MSKSLDLEFKKLFYLMKIRVGNIFFRHKKQRNPKLFMTLLVKNEEDIIEENLIFHKAMGVDGFIVTDNNSTDKTIEILKKYEKKGWIKKIIIERAENYEQQIWVDRMIKIARDEYDADWVINCDADELWYSNKKNLKLDINNSTCNVIKCNIYNIIPNENKKFYESTSMVVKHIEDDKKYELSKFNIYTKQIPKVIHRTSGYKMISIGNHNVKIRFKNEINSKNIIIFHYSIRNLEHFKNKMINTGRAFEKNINLDKNIGRHCRYFYEGWKNDILNLDNEYKKSLGYQYYDIFKNNGIIEQNNDVKEFFENYIYKEECILYDK